mmetsp:Transcript_469/g.1846  ORF Transcript_469/g.1846 Transcript_469/m.1846 type:complete len:279 (-) Transcript_469:506-1342(-)
MNVGLCGLQVSGLLELCDPEVRDLGRPLLVQQDVLGLEVAVHNPRVKVGEGPGDLQAEPDNLLGLHLVFPRVDPVVKGSPGHELLHQEDPPARRRRAARPEHHNDVLMVELAQHLHLFPEGAQMLLSRMSRGDGLDGHLPPSPRRPVDHPKGAAADDLVQLHIFAAHVQVQTDLGRAALVHQGPGGRTRAATTLLPPPERDGEAHSPDGGQDDRRDSDGDRDGCGAPRRALRYRCPIPCRLDLILILSLIDAEGVPAAALGVVQEGRVQNEVQDVGEV